LAVSKSETVDKNMQLDLAIQLINLNEAARKEKDE
jgi:hypothetical protein